MEGKLMANYVDIMERYYPSESVNCNGDPNDYSNLTFEGTVRTKAELDALWLGLYKEYKIAEINKRTDELIGQGFTFDSNNFGLDVDRRLDWLGLETLKASLTWPKTIINSSGAGYSLAEADVTNFVLTGAGTYESHIASGGALKAQVIAATTEAEVDAVVDNR